MLMKVRNFLGVTQRYVKRRQSKKDEIMLMLRSMERQNLERWRIYMANTSDLNKAIDRLSTSFTNLLSGVNAEIAAMKTAQNNDDSDALDAAIARLDGLTAQATAESAQLPSGASDVGSGGTSVSGTPLVSPPDASGSGSDTTGSAAPAGASGSSGSDGSTGSTGATGDTGAPVVVNPAQPDQADVPPTTPAATPTATGTTEGPSDAQPGTSTMEPPASGSTINGNGDGTNTDGTLGA